MTGGYRYRGPYARLRGFYVFGDLDGGLLIGQNNGATWSLSAFSPASPVVSGVYGFGEDEVGNLYVASGYDGKVYKYALDEIFADGFEL